MKNLVALSLFPFLCVFGCAKDGGSAGGASKSSAAVDLPGAALSGYTIEPPPNAKLSAKNDHRADIEAADIKLHVEKPKANVDRATIASFKASSEKKTSFKGWVVDEPETIVGEDPAGRFGIMSLVLVKDTKFMCSGTLEGPNANAERAKDLKKICASIKAK